MPKAIQEQQRSVQEKALVDQNHKSARKIILTRPPSLFNDFMIIVHSLSYM